VDRDGDEIANPNALTMKTTLNGQLMQDHTTSDMIFDVPALIESLSSTIDPAEREHHHDGTPHGVGFARKPPVWLKKGDVVSVEIEKIRQTRESGDERNVRLSDFRRSSRTVSPLPVLRERVRVRADFLRDCGALTPPLSGVPGEGERRDRCHTNAAP
jgi:hypothetical protein